MRCEPVQWLKNFNNCSLDRGNGPLWILQVDILKTASHVIWLTEIDQIYSNQNAWSCSRGFWTEENILAAVTLELKKRAKQTKIVYIARTAVTWKLFSFQSIHWVNQFRPNFSGCSPRFAWRRFMLSLFCSRAGVTSSAPDRASTWRTKYLNLTLPSRASTCHGQRVGSWLVKIARARTVMVTGTFAFYLYQKRTGWMFWLPVFGVKWCFSRWSPSDFNTLEVSQGEVPPSVMSEGGCCEIFEQQLALGVCRLKIHRLSLYETPVSGDHRVSAAYEMP